MFTTIRTFTNECVVITYTIKAQYYNWIIVHTNIKIKYLAFSLMIILKE